MGKFDSLLIDLDLEKQNLERLVSELTQLLQTLKGKATFTEVRAAGSILHDFYTGLEKIFERIALIVDGGMPEGEDWHIQLLRRMAVPVPERRPAVMSKELTETLAEYLRFRHLFRNIYGFELEWERLQKLVEKLPSVYKDLESDLKKFRDFLAQIT